MTDESREITRSSRILVSKHITVPNTAPLSVHKENNVASKKCVATSNPGVYDINFEICYFSYFKGQQCYK